MTGARPRTVYAVTAKGRRALRRWLDEPPAAPSLEFEGLVKVFFADGGTLEQLRSTLTAIADASDALLAELQAKVEQHATGDVPFPERLPINSVALRFQLDHERLIGSWARWALDQVADWRSPTDPGSWGHLDAFSGDLRTYRAPQ